MKLLWTVQCWEPGIHTYSGHRRGEVRVVTVWFDSGGVASPYRSSHRAAAAWACKQVATSLDAFALAIGSCAICGARGDQPHDANKHYLATVEERLP
jgi:hypothetical protein